MNATATHDTIALTPDEYSDLKNVKTEVGNIQQWETNPLPDKIVHGTKSGEILGPLKVEKSRLRELSLVNEHNMYELVKNANALGGSHVHAEWLQDHKGDEVRCRLVATQLTMGERLDVTQKCTTINAGMAVVGDCFTAR